MYVYKKMIEEVVLYGTRKENRTGVDTLSTFNFNYELCWDKGMLWGLPPAGTLIDERNDEGYAVPLLTTKEISWKNICVELLWFLSGDPHIDFLKRHKCKFWDPWADEKGLVPSAYGNFWRHFPVHEQVPVDLMRSTAFKTEPRFNDQISWVLNELRRNPMSRRLVVSAWAPGNAQTSKLPPCHLLFAFNVQMTPRGEQRLCLHLTQRSCDLALGVPYNMASYGLLLLIMSHLTGIKPGIFAHTLLDLHIYTKKPGGEMAEYDHVLGLKEQSTRPTRALPRVIIKPNIKELHDIEALMAPGVSTQHILDTFKLVGYDPHPPIKFKVAV